MVPMVPGAGVQSGLTSELYHSSQFIVVPWNKNAKDQINALATMLEMLTSRQGARERR
jgi:hypothetical protein